MKTKHTWHTRYALECRGEIVLSVPLNADNATITQDIQMHLWLRHPDLPREWQNLEAKLILETRPHEKTTT